MADPPIDRTAESRKVDSAAATKWLRQLKELSASSISSSGISNKPSFRQEHLGFPSGPDESDSESNATRRQSNGSRCIPTLLRLLYQLSYSRDALHCKLPHGWTPPQHHESVTLRPECGDLYAPSEWHMCYTLCRGSSYAVAVYPTLSAEPFMGQVPHFASPLLLFIGCCTLPHMYNFEILSLITIQSLLRIHRLQLHLRLHSPILQVWNIFSNLHTLWYYALSLDYYALSPPNSVLMHHQHAMSFSHHPHPHRRHRHPHTHRHYWFHGQTFQVQLRPVVIRWWWGWYCPRRFRHLHHCNHRCPLAFRNAVHHSYSCCLLGYLGQCFRFQAP